MNRLKMVRQASSNESGLCCIAMVSFYFGKKRFITYYRDKFKIGRDGLSLKSMVQILQAEQFNVDLLELDFNKLLEHLHNEPLILFIDENYYVVYKRRKKDLFIINDPAQGEVALSAEELSNMFGGYALQVSPSQSFKPIQEKTSELRYMFEIVRNIKSIFSLALLVTIGSYLISLLIPMQIQNITDAIIKNDILDLRSIFTTLLVLILLTMVLSILRNKIIIKLQIKLFDELTVKTISHVLKIPYSFFDNRNEGNVLFRLEIMGQIRQFIAANLVQIIISLISIMVIIFYIGIYFTKIIVFVILSVIIMGLLILFFGRKLVKHQVENIASLEGSNVIQTEIVSNIYQIKCLKIEDYFLKEFKENFKKFKETFVVSQGMGLNLMLSIDLINAFIPIIIFILGASIFNFGYSLGQLFFLYTLISTILGLSVKFFNDILLMSAIKASLFYLNDLLDEKEHIINGTVSICELKTIEIRDLGFRYSLSTDYILRHINIKIEKGEKIALVGASGSGKSTLIKILSGLYEADEGKLLLNDIELHQLSEASLREMIAIIPQTPILFDKSIRDNLTLGKSDIGEDAIYKALSIACFKNEVGSMPMGLNTMISNSGGNLSGGQIQRLAIARTILSGAKVLILDEAMSSLDATNESDIYNNLKKLGYTILIITHRLSSIYDSDSIYVMHEGTIVDKGKHSELLKSCSMYSRLVKDQERGVL